MKESMIKSDREGDKSAGVRKRYKSVGTRDRERSENVKVRV